MLLLADNKVMLCLLDLPIYRRYRYLADYRSFQWYHGWPCQIRMTFESRHVLLQTCCDRQRDSPFDYTPYSAGLGCHLWRSGGAQPCESSQGLAAHCRLLHRYGHHSNRLWEAGACHHRPRSMSPTAPPPLSWHITGRGGH